jgi:hypothetical protein
MVNIKEVDIAKFVLKLILSKGLIEDYENVVSPVLDNDLLRLYVGRMLLNEELQDNTDLILKSIFTVGLQAGMYLAEHCERPDPVEKVGS